MNEGLATFLSKLQNVIGSEVKALPRDVVNDRQHECDPLRIGVPLNQVDRSVAYGLGSWKIELLFSHNRLELNLSFSSVKGGEVFFEREAGAPGADLNFTLQGDA